MSRLTTTITFAILISNSLLAADNPFDLSSDQLEQPGSRENVVYGYKLDTMRAAEKPRFVTLIDAFQYSHGAGLGTRGVLFSYHNRAAREVRFIADIPGYAPQLMRRNKYGVWVFYYIPPEIVHNAPTKKVRYKYWVDGLLTVDDTHQAHEKDSAGQMASVFHLLGDHFSASTGTFVLDTPVKHGREVLFRIAASNADTVSIAGDFNRWNPQRDYLNKTEDGYFEIKKVIAPGEYTFLFRVDGKLKQMVATPKSRMHPVYGRVNYLVVK